MPANRSSYPPVSLPQLARQLQAYIDRKGLLQKDVAAKIGASPATISKLLGLQHLPDDATIDWRFTFLSELQALLATSPGGESRPQLKRLCAVLLRRCEDKAEFAQHRLVVIIGGGAAQWARSSTERWQNLAHEVVEAAEKAFADRAAFYNELWRELNSMEEVGLPEPALNLDQRLRQLIQDRVVRTEHICAALWGHPIARRNIIARLTAAFSPAAEDTAGDRPQRFAELVCHLARHGFIDVFLVSNIDATMSTSLTDEVGDAGFDELLLQDKWARSLLPRRPVTLVRMYGRVDQPTSLSFPPVRERQLSHESVEMLDEVVLRHRSEGGGYQLGKATIISFGYSWSDHRLANWVRSRVTHIEDIYIVRVQDKLPKLLEGDAIGPKCHLIATSDLLAPRELHASDRGTKPLALDELVWAICEQVQQEAEVHRKIMPLARHLILSHLFGACSDGTDGPEVRFRNRHGALERSVVEVMLHACKAKGMANTAVLCEDRRLSRHLAKLEESPAQILDRCRGVLRRSSWPHASDTFFLTAELAEDIGKCFSSGDLEGVCTIRTVAMGSDGQPSLQDRTVSVPRIGLHGHVFFDPQSVGDFFRKAMKDIFDAPEIEVTPGVDAQVPFMPCRG